MIIYNEIIYIILLFLLIAIWKIYFKIKTKKDIKKYKPENDKARKVEKGKSFIRGNGKGEPGIKNSNISNEGQAGFGEHRILQTKPLGAVGKDSNSDGRKHKSHKRIFGRTRSIKL
ncbi:MAG: hypothetical protein ACW98D_21660 [Promethearchaeota archaeon]|jgi:hypothetical protein